MRSCLSLIVSSVISIALLGCGEDDSNEAPDPLDPPVVRITELRSPGNGTWNTNDERRCLEPGDDPERTVIVVARVQNWTVRPYEGCGSAPQCGPIWLTVTAGVEPVYSVAAASTSIPVALKTLRFPDEAHTFRIELRDDDGPAFLDAGKPYTAEASIVVSNHCASEGDAGPPSDGGPMFDAGPGDASSPDATTMDDAGDAAAEAPDATLGDGAPADARSDAPSVPDSSVVPESGAAEAGPAADATLADALVTGG